MSILENNLRRAMARHGLTQAELAARAEVDVRTIKQILAGDSRRPHPRTLHRLAAGVGVSCDELMLPAATNGRARFDRLTNPIVEEVLADHPRLCAAWADGDYEELYSQFGTGGALTYDGTLAMIERINRKRAVHDKAALVLETEYAELLAEFVELLHRRVTAREPQRRHP